MWYSAFPDRSFPQNAWPYRGWPGWIAERAMHVITTIPAMAYRYEAEAIIIFANTWFRARAILNWIRYNFADPVLIRIIWGALYGFKKRFIKFAVEHERTINKIYLTASGKFKLKHRNFSTTHFGMVKNFVDNDSRCINHIGTFNFESESTCKIFRSADCCNKKHNLEIEPLGLMGKSVFHGNEIDFRTTRVVFVNEDIITANIETRTLSLKI